ncbi:hypothetical protein HBI50_125470 [Parastagonospora nodorum]|nr:hypothetical protein HBI50_125470 [Parastagonospora nodorum]
MLQTNIREEYRIMTLEVLRNAQIPKVFYKAAYGAKVKIEDLSNTLTLILSKTASIALITNKFSVALLTKLAILNNANIALVDAMHYSIVIDALIITLIKDDNDLLGTVNSYIKLRRLRARRKTKAADSRYAKASRERTKKDKDLEDSNTSSDVLRLRRRDRAAAYSLLDSDDYCLDSSLDINSKDNLEDEKATTAKDLLIDAYILYFKELLSDNSRIFANAISIGKTQAIIEVQNARVEGNAIEHNAVNDNNKLCPTKGERTFYCANSPPKNIGRLTKEKAIEMRINTTNAIFKALAAANKLFIIVCSFRKVDKHVFRAYNTISVTAQRTIIRKGGSYIEKRAILLPSYVTFNAINKRDSVTSDRIYKIEDAKFMLKRILKTRNLWSKLISSIKSDFLIVQNAKQQCRDILEKEGLNKLEASRRVIFNCFKMQAIFKIYSSCKVKRFTLNSVKDLFTNLSKDYFLVREARAITKSSLNIVAEDAAKAANILLPLKEVYAKILIELYKLIVQAIIVALIAFAEVITLIEATHVLAEMCVSIVYFNLDSELELKVLGKQDVKTTS